MAGLYLWTWLAYLGEERVDLRALGRSIGRPIDLLGKLLDLGKTRLKIRINGHLWASSRGGCRATVLPSVRYPLTLPCRSAFANWRWKTMKTRSVGAMISKEPAQSSTMSVP